MGKKLTSLLMMLAHLRPMSHSRCTWKLIDLEEKVVDTIDAIGVSTGKQACFFGGVYWTERRAAVRTGDTHFAI